MMRAFAPAGFAMFFYYSDKSSETGRFRTFLLFLFISVTKEKKNMVTLEAAPAGE